MASRTADSEKLAKRCRDAGWPVEDAPDGWKVNTPDNQVYLIHRTYSDVRSLKNAAAALERRGLGEAEGQRAVTRNKLRATKLAADKEAAEKKAAQLQRAANNRVMIQKAAGPYLVEPEECDVEWMTSPHPGQWPRAMYITPAAAEKILADYNIDNRHFSDPTTERYKYIMASGQWRLTHQGIAFDTRGVLQDGQHRFKAITALAALAELGDTEPDIKVPFWIFVGMPEGNFKAIDEGRVRTAAQMFAKVGVKNSNNAFTIVRTVAAYDSGNPLNYARRGKMVSALAFEARDKDPEAFDEATRWASRVYHRNRVSISAMGSAYYLIRRVNGPDNAYVEAFFEGIAQNRKYNTDRVLPVDDPRAALLARIETNNRRPKGRAGAGVIEILGWFLRAWNNIVEGNRASYLRPYSMAESPQILVCKPGSGAVPHALIGEVDA
jgi:hypothetical protein